MSYDILSELELISDREFGGFQSLPRSKSAIEKAADEIKRLRFINEELRAEIATLRAQIHYS